MAAKPLGLVVARSEGALDEAKFRQVLPHENIKRN
jgi:hypothetical protein